MENEKIKQHNTSATVGFLLTLLNLVLSFAFAISGSSVLILIFTSSTALFSLILSIIGFSRSKTIGVGKNIEHFGYRNQRLDSHCGDCAAAYKNVFCALLQ